MTTTEHTPAHIAGYEAGKAAGSWAIDGNTTTETCERILQGYEDGDPEIMDMQPAPLSGEWAGESIPELSAEHGIDLFDDDIATEFEGAYSQGYWDEVTRAARAQLGPDADPYYTHEAGA